MKTGQPQKITGSEYMQWAKKNAHIKFNLSNSGLTSYPISELNARIEDIELTGDDYYGYGPLLNAIAGMYKISSQKIFTTLGTSFANFMIFSALHRSEDEILIEHPAYEPLISTAKYVGYKVKRFSRRPENNFKIDPNEIRELITSKTKLILITNLHNPSSAYTDDATLKETGVVAGRAGAYVLVDEVYLDAAFDLHPRSAIHLGNNFIVTSSLTKVYGISGLRCGWVLAEPRLIQKMWHLNDLFYVNHVYPAEQLSVIAINNLSRLTVWSRSILGKNHKTAELFFNSRSDLEAFRPGFGTVIFSRLKKGNVEEMSEFLLQKYNTLITPGKFFEMPDYFRIGLGCEPSIFEEGLKNLNTALDEK